MAGDWIKMRVDLQTHPKVVRILSATKSDKFRVIGGLHAAWSVFDAHSTDGLLVGYSLETMDHIIGWEGFSRAVSDVGWLEETSYGLVMPEFSEHNGQSAKRRAEDQKRKRNVRKSADDPDPVRKVSAKCPQENGLEKRREEKSNPNTSPIGEERTADADQAFEVFWTAGMRKVGKKAAVRSFKAVAKKLKADPWDLAYQLADDVRARLQADQLGFDSMHPTTYLNGERWNDEIKHGTPAKQRLDPLEEFDRAIAERDARENSERMGLAEDDRDVWGPVDTRARQGSTYDLVPGDWETST